LDIEEARVSSVVNGDNLPVTQRGWKAYRRIQKAIARVLDLEVEEAFSDAERGASVEESAVA
jgi:hypothetical protein